MGAVWTGVAGMGGEMGVSVVARSRASSRRVQSGSALLPGCSITRTFRPRGHSAWRSGPPRPGGSVGTSICSTGPRQWSGRRPSRMRRTRSLSRREPASTSAVPARASRSSARPSARESSGEASTCSTPSQVPSGVGSTVPRSRASGISGWLSCSSTTSDRRVPAPWASASRLKPGQLPCGSQATRQSPGIGASRGNRLSSGGASGCAAPVRSSRRTDITPAPAGPP